MTTTTPLSHYGVTPTGPGVDTTTLWAATFLGGVNAQTVYFAEEPEHRAIEALMERFDQPSCAVTPPVKEAA